MTTGGGGVGGEIFVNIRTEGSSGVGGGVPGAGGGAPRPPGGGGGAGPKDPGMSLLNDKQKEQLEAMRNEKKALKEYQDFQKLKGKENQNELINELQRARRQATIVAGAVTGGLLARNSKIMATSTSALTQIFSAFVDVFLMPFIPLIIPVLSSLAKMVPQFQSWWTKLVSDKGWAGALKEAGALLWDLFKDTATDIAGFFGISEESMNTFFTNIEGYAKTTWGVIKAGWTAAVDYFKGAWEEGGCTVFGLISVVGQDAMNVVKMAGTWLWENWPQLAKKAWDITTEVGTSAFNKFAEWQPELAAKIEGYWSSAVGYIKSTWEEAGCQFGPFLKLVAVDAWNSIVQGLTWIWEDGGGGLKDAFTKLFVGMGDFLEEKTGMRWGLPQASSRVNPETGLAESALGDTSINPGIGRTILGDILSGEGIIHGQSGERMWEWSKAFGSSLWNVGKDRLLDPEGRYAGVGWQGAWSDIDFGGGRRGQYEATLERKLGAFLTEMVSEKQGLDPNYKGDLQDFAQQLNVQFSTQSQFGIQPTAVVTRRRNGQIEVNVEIEKDWNGNDFLDGVGIDLGG